MIKSERFNIKNGKLKSRAVAKDIESQYDDGSDNGCEKDRMNLLEYLTPTLTQF
jgi:hypothetical protein